MGVGDVCGVHSDGGGQFGFLGGVEVDSEIGPMRTGWYR